MVFEHLIIEACTDESVLENIIMEGVKTIAQKIEKVFEERKIIGYFSKKYVDENGKGILVWSLPNVSDHEARKEKVTNAMIDINQMLYELYDDYSITWRFEAADEEPRKNKN